MLSNGLSSVSSAVNSVMGSGISALRNGQFLPSSLLSLSETVETGQRPNGFDLDNSKGTLLFEGPRDRWPSEITSRTRMDPECAVLCRIIYKEAARILSDFEYLGYEVLSINLDDRPDMDGSTFALLRHRQEDLVVVVFRGTKSVSDLITNLSFKPQMMEDDDPPFGVHSGMLEAAKSAIRQFLPHLIDSHLARPVRRLLITGHSMGGGIAIATHFCLEHRGILNDGPLSGCEASTVAFGAPLVFSGACSLDNPAVIAVHHGLR